MHPSLEFARGVISVGGKGILAGGGDFLGGLPSIRLKRCTNAGTEKETHALAQSNSIEVVGSIL